MLGLLTVRLDPTEKATPEQKDRGKGAQRRNRQTMALALGEGAVTPLASEHRMEALTSVYACL